MARFDLTDFEWSVIQPRLPNKPRAVPRVDDRRVLSSIFWRLRTGAPRGRHSRALRPDTTYVNRFNRWRRPAHDGRSARDMLDALGDGQTFLADRAVTDPVHCLSTGRLRRPHGA
jgi:hypothetical protein